ncbi:uncharacterized protein LOC118199659 [Stegodyphus dumicola]|uniref:uncharacterized protein LOC118199659 n=1 Tax=Stegodyphus dumicola TaxID=202533 RepID=UPI0015B0D6C0|nr:uncharacterized protein LOC118199659 [Stegodyphus dumicola]
MQRSRSISRARILDDEEISPPTPSVYFTPPGSRCGLLLHNTVEEATTHSSFARSRRLIEASRGNSKIPVFNRKANYNPYTEKKIPISSIQHESHKSERIRWQGGHREYPGKKTMNGYYVNMRFKSTFTAFGEKRYCGTMIEKEMHICWMRCSRLELDKDGEIFKYFLGRKRALNFEEYKQFLEELCDIYELDYSEIIKTMAFIRMPSTKKWK